MDLLATVIRFPDLHTASPLSAALQDLTERRLRTLSRSHPAPRRPVTPRPVLRDPPAARRPTVPATNRSLRIPTRAPDRPAPARTRTICHPIRTAAPVIHPAAAQATPILPSRTRRRVPTTLTPPVPATPAQLPVIPPSARATQIPVPATPVPSCLTPKLPVTRPCTRVLPVRTGRPQNRAGLIPA